MKKVIIIHRWSGSPNDDWRPWLARELTSKGYELIVPNMPDTETPTIDAWVNKIAELVKTPDENTYFIGHSIGCQAIIRYLQTINTKVG